MVHLIRGKYTSLMDKRRTSKTRHSMHARYYCRIICSKQRRDVDAKVRTFSAFAHAGNTSTSSVAVFSHPCMKGKCPAVLFRWIYFRSNHFVPYIVSKRQANGCLYIHAVSTSLSLEIAGNGVYVVFLCLSTHNT